MNLLVQRTCVVVANAHFQTLTQLVCGRLWQPLQQRAAVPWCVAAGQMRAALCNRKLACPAEARQVCSVLFDTVLGPAENHH